MIISIYNMAKIILGGKNGILLASEKIEIIPDR